MLKKVVLGVLCGLVMGQTAHADAERAKVYRDAEQAFLERTSLKAADDKCAYFTELERSALTAGQLQSRGELLRSGVFTREAIDEAAAEVQRYANSQPCGQSDFIAARAHLKNAFEAFVGTMVMDYPGLIAEWNASRSRWDTWRIVQNGSTQSYLFQFGLLAPLLPDPDEFDATFSRPLDAPLRSDPYDLSLELILTGDKAPPSLARILIRDPVKAPEPWLGSLFSDEIKPPPIGLTRAYWASARELITDEKSGERKLRFKFSPEATAAIERLDPREQFEIAVLPNARSGESQPEILTIEVGDFAAAHAFVTLPPL